MLPTNRDVFAVEPRFILASHVRQDVVRHVEGESVPWSRTCLQPGVRYVVGESVPWPKTWWCSIVPFPLSRLLWIISQELRVRVSATVPSGPFRFELFLMFSFRTSAVHNIGQRKARRRRFIASGLRSAVGC